MKSYARLLLIFLFCVGTHGKLEYNTFAKTVKRSTVFSTIVSDQTCLLKPDPGPCRAAIDMYYYDPKDMNCTSTFKWGGCMGNGNRFDTYGECMESCLTQPGQNTRPTYCSLRFDYGFCFGDTKRWYYDQMWQVCKETIYSGCGGNKNNFYNQHQCEAVCRIGSGRATKAPTTSLVKKVLIINPPDTTPHRGKNQKTTTTRASTTKKGDGAPGNPAGMPGATGAPGLPG